MMPPVRRRHIGRNILNARRMVERRAQLTQEQLDEMNEQFGDRMSQQRTTQPQEQQLVNRIQQEHNREIHSLHINANRRASRRSLNVQLKLEWLRINMTAP